MRCTVLLVYGEGKGGGCLKRRRLMAGAVFFAGVPRDVVGSLVFFLASAFC
jgi:hypothetical protein